MGLVAPEAAPVVGGLGAGVVEAMPVPQCPQATTPWSSAEPFARWPGAALGSVGGELPLVGVEVVPADVAGMVVVDDYLPSRGGSS